MAAAADQPRIRCNCGYDAFRKTCTDPSNPNSGREFFVCPRNACRFFESADGKPWIKRGQQQQARSRGGWGGGGARAAAPPPPSQKRGREEFEGEDDEQSYGVVDVCDAPATGIAGKAQEFYQNAKRARIAAEQEGGSIDSILSTVLKLLEEEKKTKGILLAIFEKLCPPGCRDVEKVVAAVATNAAPQAITALTGEPPRPQQPTSSSEFRQAQ